MTEVVILDIVHKIFQLGLTLCSLSWYWCLLNMVRPSHWWSAMSSILNIPWYHQSLQVVIFPLYNCNIHLISFKYFQIIKIVFLHEHKMLYLFIEIIIIIFLFLQKICYSYTESGFMYNRVFHTNGLMRTRLNPDASKMIICTTGGYLILIHNLDLKTLKDDLDGFKVCRQIL